MRAKFFARASISIALPLDGSEGPRTVLPQFAAGPAVPHRAGVRKEPLTLLIYLALAILAEYSWRCAIVRIGGDSTDLRGDLLTRGDRSPSGRCHVADVMWQP